jgi:hypothetical protein
LRATAIAMFLLLPVSGSALADAYSCRSLAGDPPVTLDFDLRYSSGTYAVTRAAFQIEDEIGYSTTAEHPQDRATVTGLEAGAEEVRFSLHYAGVNYDADIATVHVVTLAEGAHTLTAGVLHVVAGGLWPVQCDIAYEG